MKFGIVLWGLFLGLLLGGPPYIILCSATILMCGIMGAREEKKRKSKNN